MLPRYLVQLPYCTEICKPACMRRNIKYIASVTPMAAPLWDSIQRHKTGLRHL